MAIGAIVVVVVGLVQIFTTPPSPPSAEELAYSVTQEIGGTTLLGVEPCRRSGAAWRCSVEDREGSGNAVEYRVTVDGRCWRARGKGGSFAGCVGDLDELRLFDRYD